METQRYPSDAFSGGIVELPTHHLRIVQDKLHSMTLRDMADELASDPSPKRTQAVALLKQAQDLLEQEHLELKAAENR